MIVAVIPLKMRFSSTLIVTLGLSVLATIVAASLVLRNSQDEVAAPDLADGRTVLTSNAILSWLVDYENRSILLRIRNPSSKPVEIYGSDEYFCGSIFVRHSQETFAFRHKRWAGFLMIGFPKSDFEFGLLPEESVEWQIPFDSLMSYKIAKHDTKTPFNISEITPDDKFVIDFGIPERIFEEMHGIKPDSNAG